MDQKNRLRYEEEAVLNIALQFIRTPGEPG